MKKRDIDIGWLALSLAVAFWALGLFRLFAK